MKRIIACLTLILVFFSSACADSSVWVEESWSRIDREVDCNGHPLLIHAKVLEIPDGLEVCQYHLDYLNMDYMAEKAEQIDWAALDFDTTVGSWNRKGDTYSFLPDKGFYPHCHLYSICDIQLTNTDNEYIYEAGTTHSVDVDHIEIEGLSREKIMEKAEEAAAALGIRLGDVLRVNKFEDTQKIYESMNEIVTAHGTVEPIAPEEAAGYAFTDVVFPVYINGMRFFSGTWSCMGMKTDIPNMYFQLVVSPGHGILQIESALIDPKRLKAITEPQPVISVEEVLNRIEKKYAEEDWENKKSATVQTVALEYAPVTNDITSGKGYTVHPAWVARISEDITVFDEPYTYYTGYDAVTGELLFD